MQAFCQKIFNCRYKYTLKRKFVTQSEQKRQKKMEYRRTPTLLTLNLIL